MPLITTGDGVSLHPITAPTVGVDRMVPGPVIGGPGGSLTCSKSKPVIPLLGGEGKPGVTVKVQTYTLGAPEDGVQDFTAEGFGSDGGGGVNTTVTQLDANGEPVVTQTRWQIGPLAVTVIVSVITATAAAVQPPAPTVTL